MKGIILKDSIRNFGFKTGINFWFKWSFINPIEMFIWLNITHKPYCNWAGFHCKDENCRHKHTTDKKEILKIWKSHEEESKIIRGSSDGICAYCGKEKGTEIIDDPNGTLERWKVCKTCEEVIKIQQELVFLSIMSNRMDNPKRAEELNNRLLEISKQTGKPITNIQINKEADGYKTSGVTFTGKGK